MEDIDAINDKYCQLKSLKKQIEKFCDVYATVATNLNKADGQADSCTQRNNQLMKWKWKLDLRWPSRAPSVTSIQPASNQKSDPDQETITIHTRQRQDSRHEKKQPPVDEERERQESAAVIRKASRDSYQLFDNQYHEIFSGEVQKFYQRKNIAQYNAL